MDVFFKQIVFFVTSRTIERCYHPLGDKIVTKAGRTNRCFGLVRSLFRARLPPLFVLSTWQQAPSTNAIFMSQNSFFRIIDAAANRTAEGLRVAEDVMRMHLNDQNLAKQLKQLRHDLAEVLASLPIANSIAARDSIGDVGRNVQVKQEYDRSLSASESDSSNPELRTQEANESGFTSYEPLLIANFKRAQQAIRTLEEFSKSESEAVAKAIEQIRYRCYTLEKACRLTMRANAIFASVSIYVLIDGCQWSETCSANEGEVGVERWQGTPLAKTVQALVDAGVDFIQLRDKKLSDRQLVAAGRVITSLTRDTPTGFIMNDRADIALTCGADGVHVGQEELSVADARRVIGPGKLIGVSTHSLDQARAAVVQGADYIGVGPVFASQTKSFSQQVGTALVKEICSEVSLPAFAIGGIDLTNAAQVAAAGCGRVAVTAMYATSSLDQYGQVTQQLRAQLQTDSGVE